ncbi:MAG: tetratricopeptide repeat protein [Chloroflexi bacterium]|nr:tetratricopeptide repeat protein [Chloroflexota bacterium]
MDRVPEGERDAALRAELASILDIVGRPLDAASQLQRPVACGVEKAYVRRRLGVLLFRLGKHPGVADCLGGLGDGQTADADFSDVFARYALSSAYGELGRLEDSHGQLEIIATRVPRRGGLLAARGSLGRRVAEARTEEAGTRGEEGASNDDPIVQGAFDDLDRALALNPALITAREEMGMLYELLGDGKAALQQYAQAMAIEASHPNARCRAARLFLRSNQPDEALRILKEAEREGHLDAALRNVLGEVYESKGMLSEAAECYRQATTLRSDEPVYRRNLAMVLAGTHRREAQEEMERAVAMRPEEAEWRWELGALLEDSGDLERALAEYQQAIDRSTGRSKYYRSLGSLARRLGRLSQASDALSRAISLEPIADNYGEMSRLRLKEGRVPDALRNADRALKLAPDDPAHRLGHAVALKFSGQTEKALTTLERLVAEQPQYAAAYFELGLLVEEVGRVEQALKLFTRAVELRDNDLEYRLALARANRLVGRQGEAASIIRRLLRKSLRNPDVLQEAAKLAESQGKLPEAIETFQRAIKVEPRPRLYRDLAHTLAKARRFEEALDAMRSALKIEPGNPDWVSEMGDICELRGVDDEAIEHYQKALKLDPLNPRFHRNLGVVFKRLGRYEDAMAELKRALELDPEYEEAYQQLSAAQASALLRKTMGS